MVSCLYNRKYFVFDKIRVRFCNLKNWKLPMGLLFGIINIYGTDMLKKDIDCSSLWLFPLITRYMYRGWMIDPLEHLNDVLQIHLKYMDHVRIRSAMSISIEVDRTVGSQRVWRFMVIIRGLLLFTTTPSFRATFGMDLIIATVLLLRDDRLARDHSYLWFFGLFYLHSYKCLRKVPNYLH